MVAFLLRTPAYSVRRIISKAFCLSSKSPFNLHSPYRPIVEWASGGSLPSIDCCFGPSNLSRAACNPVFLNNGTALPSNRDFKSLSFFDPFRTTQWTGKRLDKENSFPNWTDRIRRFFWNKLAEWTLLDWYTGLGRRHSGVYWQYAP